jgi:hypothetical protein
MYLWEKLRRPRSLFFLVRGGVYSPTTFGGYFRRRGDVMGLLIVPPDLAWRETTALLFTYTMRHGAWFWRGARSWSVDRAFDFTSLLMVSGCA